MASSDYPLSVPVVGFATGRGVRSRAVGTERRGTAVGTAPAGPRSRTAPHDGSTKSPGSLRRGMAVPGGGVPDWVTLTDDEEVVWIGRPSLHRIAPRIVGGAVLVLVGLLLNAFLPQDLPFRGAAYLPVPLGMLVVAVAYVRHQSVRYVITTNEVYKKTGLISREVTTLRLDRVQNTTFTQSLFERFLSYGDLYIETAGTAGTEMVFEAVPDPEGVSSQLTEQLDRL